MDLVVYYGFQHEVATQQIVWHSRTPEFCSPKCFGSQCMEDSTVENKTNTDSIIPLTADAIGVLDNSYRSYIGSRPGRARIARAS